MTPIKLIAVFSAAAVSALSAQVVAQEVQPGIFKVPQGGSQKIDRFGVCRMIENGGNNPIMVPANSAQEWSSGARAFLANVGNMPGVKVSNCGPRFDDGCFLWASGAGAGAVTEYETYNHWSGPIETISRQVIGETAVDPRYVINPAFPRISDMIGEGEYPDSFGTEDNPGALRHATYYTFDSFAIGSDTTVEFFKGKNFTGKSMTFHGPLVGENAGLDMNYSSRPLDTHYKQGENWSNSPIPLIQQFTPPTRRMLVDHNIDPAQSWVIGVGIEGTYRAEHLPLRDMEYGSVRVTCSEG